LRDDRLEQFFLVREVEIKRAFGDAGAMRHVVEPGRGKAVFGKTVQRGVEDFARAGLLAAAPSLRLNASLGQGHNNLPVSYLNLITGRSDIKMPSALRSGNQRQCRQVREIARREGEPIVRASRRTAPALCGKRSRPARAGRP